MNHKACWLLLAFFPGCLLLGCNSGGGTADVRFFTDDSGQVTAITMVGKHVTDADLRNAAQHEQLTELRLQECSQVTKAGLSYLHAIISKLQVIELVRVPIDDSSLKDLSNAESLTELTLANTDVTGSGIRELASCPLIKLTLVSRAVTADGMRSLATLSELEELELQCQELPLEDLDSIGQLKSLKKLIAYRTPVGKQGLKILRGLDQLQWLHLNSSEIDDSSVETLNTLANLEWLEIDNGSFTNTGLSQLRLGKLTHLSLDGCKGITDEGLGNFTGMPALEWLMLGGTGVAGIDLTPLSTLPNLKEVRLMGDQFRGSDESIQALKAKLPACEVVIMRG